MIPTMKQAIFIPSREEKEKTGKCCLEIIDVIEKAAGEDVMLKSYIMQMLIETFEDVHKIDIRNAISIKKQ